MKIKASLIQSSVDIFILRTKTNNCVICGTLSIAEYRGGIRKHKRFNFLIRMFDSKQSKVFTYSDFEPYHMDIDPANAEKYQITNLVRTQKKNFTQGNISL